MCCFPLYQYLWLHMFLWLKPIQTVFFFVCEPPQTLELHCEHLQCGLGPNRPGSEHTPFVELETSLLYSLWCSPLAWVNFHAKQHLLCAWLCPLALSSGWSLSCRDIFWVMFLWTADKWREAPPKKVLSRWLGDCCFPAIVTSKSLKLSPLMGRQCFQLCQNLFSHRQRM